MLAFIYEKIENKSLIQYQWQIYKLDIQFSSWTIYVSIDYEKHAYMQFEQHFALLELYSNILYKYTIMIVLLQYLKECVNDWLFDSSA